MSEHLNKIPKETLTIQNIKQDIKEIYKPSISIFFVFGILGAIFLLLAGEFWDETKIKHILSVILTPKGCVFYGRTRYNKIASRV